MGKPKPAALTGKTAARAKQVEKLVPCVRVPEHRSIPVDFHPAVGRAMKARGCAGCGIVWRFTTFRWQGPYVLLAEGVKFP